LRKSIATRVSSSERGEAAPMNHGGERNRYLTIFLLAAPGAAIIWYVFHAVYESLSVSEKAVGYVDAMTQMGIDFGYVVMIGGTVLLASLAVWSAIAYIRLVLRDR
jgi:hypothetical protein